MQQFKLMLPLFFAGLSLQACGQKAQTAQESQQKSWFGPSQEQSEANETLLSTLGTYQGTSSSDKSKCSVTITKNASGMAVIKFQYKAEQKFASELGSEELVGTDFEASPQILLSVKGFLFGENKHTFVLDSSPAPLKSFSAEKGLTEVIECLNLVKR